ncbi:uncharacterized protein [Montipora capricornis]|uniref:uncharacterized protein n=1 Tax=Montipora capricornis TaxID=246305 RepID=UPI0035F1CD99
MVPLALNKIFELDFHERFDEKSQQYLQEDKKFLKNVDQGIGCTDDNHYEITLPFHSDDVCFPDNREQVLQRACWLKRKFTRNSQFYEGYVNFMNDIIRKGFARKVPEDRAPAKSGQLWYIPHHGVYHPRKPNKIRVVFWWPSGNLHRDLAEYQMNVHLFGAVSSPSSSNFALRQVLRKNFYVDDCLRSEESQKKRLFREYVVYALHVLMEASTYRRLFAIEEGCWRACQDLRAQGLRALDLSSNFLPVERALGVQWAVESDTFGFRIILKDKPLTRRGILSTICSIFDPLGMAAPFLLTAKKILQDLCRTKLDSDDEIDDEFHVGWENWRSQLSALEHF